MESVASVVRRGLSGVTKESLPPYYAQLMLHFPCILHKRRSEEGRLIRRQYRNDRGVPYSSSKEYQPDRSGVCDCLTTFTTDNNIMNLTVPQPSTLIYHPNPTKEVLLEYFAHRIRVRKMTETEALRLMDVTESIITLLEEATRTVTLKNGKTKTKKAISKTALYKLAGNSIVVAMLYYIFRNLFIQYTSAGEARQTKVKPHLYQMTIFDLL